MTNESESNALQYLHTSSANKGLMFEHRVLYEGDIQPEGSDDAIRIVAMELAQKAFVIFSITKRPVDEASYGSPTYEFVAFCEDRNKAIQTVFNLATKS